MKNSATTSAVVTNAAATSSVATNATAAKEIMRLERRFWQAMCDEDVDTAVDMLDRESAIAGGMGIHHFDAAGYRDMAENGPMKITAFELSDEKVFFPTPDVAIATYTVNQTFEVDGKSQAMVAHDTTTWVKKDGKWVAPVHTESPQQSRAS